MNSLSFTAGQIAATTIVAAMFLFARSGIAREFETPEDSPIRTRSSPLATPRPVTASGRPSPIAMTAIRNRARTLGGKKSGAGTRYFSVTSNDLRAAKSTSEMVKRLSPPRVAANDGTRRIEIHVEVNARITLVVPRGSTVRIGTVNVDQHVRNLVVNANVDASGLKIIGR